MQQVLILFKIILEKQCLINVFQCKSDSSYNELDLYKSLDRLTLGISFGVILLILIFSKLCFAI